MNAAVTNLFNEYRQLTGSVDAAAALVLADVTLGKQTAQPTANADTLNPPDVAKQLRVSPTKVIGWIRSGQLKAANIATGPRPRYVIQRADLDTFLMTRQPDPPVHRSARRRQSSTDRY